MRAGDSLVRGRIVVGRPRGDAGQNRRDKIQKLENQQLGRAVTGNFRTTNLAVVMAELGLRLAECLLNNRTQRHALRLMSLPKGQGCGPGGFTFGRAGPG